MRYTHPPGFPPRSIGRRYTDILLGSKYLLYNLDKFRGILKN